MKKSTIRPVISWTLKELGAEDNSLGKIQDAEVVDYINNSEFGECLNFIETNFLLDTLPAKRMIFEYKINKPHYLDDEGYHEPFPVDMKAILSKIINCGDCFVLIANDFDTFAECNFIIEDENAYII